MSKNFQSENAAVLIAFLRLGRDKAAQVAPAKATMNPYGCRCCGTEYVAPAPHMRSISTTVSGSQLHKLAVMLGLIID